MTGAVLVQASASTAETAELLEAAEALPFVLGVVGWADLHVSGRRLRHRRAAGRSGGRTSSGSPTASTTSEDPAWLAATRRAPRAGHAGGAGAWPSTWRCCTRELTATLDVARRCLASRIVLHHLARPPIASGDLAAWGRALLPLAELPNVVAKLSGLVTEADWHTWSIDDLRHPVELAVDAFGADG